MKVVGYIRVSTVQQDLNRQKKLIRDYCNSKGFNLIKMESDKISGATAERDGLNKILSLTKKDADLVVVSELSRLSREDDAHKIISKVYDILDNGLDLVLLDQPDKIYRASEGIAFVDYLTLAIKAFGAADERKKIVSRMRSGLMEKLDIYPNMASTSIIPFGYKSVPNSNFILHQTPKSFIAIDEETSKYVKMIYQFVIDGKTSIEIADIMNDMNIKGQRKGDFHSSLVCRIIRNPYYKGDRIYKGKTYKIDAIVDETTWSKANKMLESNKAYKGNCTSHIFPLKNILKCACGKNMIAKHTRIDRSIYACVSKITTDKCDNSGLKIETLDRFVWEDIKKRVLDKEYQAKNSEEIDKIIAANLSLEDSIADIKKDTDKLSSKLEKLAEKIALEEDEFLISALRKQFIKFKEELKTKEASISNIYSMITENNLKIDSLSKIEQQSAIANLSDLEKKDLYQKLLNKVTYYSESKISGFIVIDYKNGFKAIGANYTRPRVSLYSLPAVFKFNPETRKVWISKSVPDKELDSNLSQIPRNVELSIKELKGYINLDKYKKIKAKTYLNLINRSTLKN